MPVVPLFGGAIVADLPTTFVDISDFRNVPDHQEVWADGDKDQSVVIELVDPPTTTPTGEPLELDGPACLRYYWSDLADGNECPLDQAHITSTEILDPTQLGTARAEGIGVGGGVAWAGVVRGRQRATKGRQLGEDKTNEVAIALAVLRLPSVATDVLVSVNAPVVIAAGSASAAHAGSGDKPTGDACAAEVIQRVLGSFRILDWGL